MSKLSITQRIAKLIGKDAGANTWFGPDIMDPDNRNVYRRIGPYSTSSIALGSVTKKYLWDIFKARIKSLFTDRIL